MSGELLEMFVDERLDQSEAMSFTIPARSRKAYLLTADAEMRWRDRRFYIDEIEDIRDGTETTITVEANATWYRLGDTTRVGSVDFRGLTPEQGIEDLLAGTGWVPGSITETTDIYSMEEQDSSVLALLRTWSKITGLGLVFNSSTNSVDLLADRGRDLGLGFRYRRNVSRVRRRTRPPELTVLYAYGADDLNIAGVNAGLEYVEDFSYYTAQGLTIDEARALFTRSRVWADSSFLIDTDLLAAAEERLSRLSKPTVSYELDVVDLSELVTAETEAIRVGDTVRVHDPDFGENLRTTVVRTVRYPYQPWRNKIELSYLLDPIGDGSRRSRPSTALQWVQFVGPVSATFLIRNDAVWTIARIPLSFRAGGKANYHLDFVATGVGDGVLSVEIYDAANEEAVFRPAAIPYTNGETTQVSLSWAGTELEGSKDYRVRVTTIADGGPDPANGVNISQDADNEASWWILAQGAIQQTPPGGPNSARYESGQDNRFTVPDNVTQMTIEVAGGRGGNSQDRPANLGGKGGIVTATFTVTPGETYKVVCGAHGSATREPGLPNGGEGKGSAIDGNLGRGGGGSSWVRRLSDPDESTPLVHAGAGGGGGPGEFSINTNDSVGGDGGFFQGGESFVVDSVQVPAGGATQFAGGVGGEGASGFGNPGTFLQGGDAGGDNLAGKAGGGGGGGWYGGGGGGFGGALATGPSGGGGGSGFLDPSAFDPILADGANDGAGYVEFRWENPD